MLFIVNYIQKHDTEETEARNQEVFKNWTPPAGFEFKSHYAFADGLGGTAIVETDSAATLYESTMPFHVFVEFDIHPAIDIAEATPIADKVIAWRDSVG